MAESGLYSGPYLSAFRHVASDQGYLVMWNIIIGLVFIIGGLSGRLVLIGTNSGPALAALGGGMLILGLVRVSRSTRR